MADVGSDKRFRRRSLIGRSLGFLVGAGASMFAPGIGDSKIIVASLLVIVSGLLGLLALLASSFSITFGLASMVEILGITGIALIDPALVPGCAVAIVGTYSLGLASSDRLVIPCAGLVSFAGLLYASRADLTDLNLVLLIVAGMFIVFGPLFLQAHRRSLLDEISRRDELLNRSEAVLWEMDRRTGEFTYVSGHGAEFGLSIKEWLADPAAWLEIVEPADRIRVTSQALLEAADRGTSIEVRAVPPDFKRALRISPNLVTENRARQPHIRGVMLDITERQKSETQIRYQARHDALTGLPNRSVLRDKIDGALAQREPDVAVLGLDLDRFKEVNDALGHDKGDELLQHVATRLTAVVGDRGTVARTGGDEFVIVVNGPGARASAQVLAAAMHEQLTSPFEIDGLNLNIGGSFGLASSPEDGREAATLLRRADVSMYAAKRSGGGVAVYDPIYEREAQLAALRAAKFPTALERGAVHVHLQPRVDVSTGRVVGCEVFARWNDPELGEVAAPDIVSTAEVGGLGQDLFMSILRQGLAAVGRMRRLGHDIELAVNVTTSGLIAAGLAQLVSREIDLAGVPADLLTFEIQEEDLMRNARMLSDVIRDFDSRGIKVAVDAFGAGTISLAWLRSLPLHTIKLDRSILDRADRSTTDRAIASSLIGLAQQLGLKVVAQGVERAETLQVARELSCNSYQGNLFAPALAPQELEVLLRWQQADGPVHTV
jgi:diguanylate cyclase (GGDEF)-like protein